MYYMCVEEERFDFILDIFFLQVGFGRVFLLLNIFEIFFAFTGVVGQWSGAY